MCVNGAQLTTAEAISHIDAMIGEVTNESITTELLEIRAHLEQL